MVTWLAVHGSQHLIVTTWSDCGIGCASRIITDMMDWANSCFPSCFNCLYVHVHLYRPWSWPMTHHQHGSRTQEKVASHCYHHMFSHFGLKIPWDTSSQKWEDESEQSQEWWCVVRLGWYDSWTRHSTQDWGANWSFCDLFFWCVTNTLKYRWCEFCVGSWQFDTESMVVTTWWSLASG